VKLLALDTATEQCSAALWLEGVVSVREAQRSSGHGELILSMIDELLSTAQLALRELTAIAYGRGPGAFTGVRLAVGVAQGLGFAAGVPLLAISDLRAVAAQALGWPAAEGPSRVLVCQDARMGEVYWGCFESRAGDLVPIGSEAVGAPEAVALPAAWAGEALLGAGSGFEAHPSLRLRLERQLSAVWPQLRPHAREIAWLASREDPSAALGADQAQPVYLRDQIATPRPS
jgi:tRNA threonylcarbamoyladenosine biosynthesis protein TsaB